jgi:hypothetical protein
VVEKMEAHGASVGGEPGPAAVEVTMRPSRANKHEAGRERISAAVR